LTSGACEVKILEILDIRQIRLCISWKWGRDEGLEAESELGL